jgi:hypothetical protein
MRVVFSWEDLGPANARPHDEPGCLAGFCRPPLCRTDHPPASPRFQPCAFGRNREPGREPASPQCDQTVRALGVLRDHEVERLGGGYSR